MEERFLRQYWVMQAIMKTHMAWRDENHYLLHYCQPYVRLLHSRTDLCQLKTLLMGGITIPYVQAGHKSPQQLFTAGCLLLQNSQLPALDFFHSDDTYGTDTDGPLSLSEGSVSVPQSSLRFCDADIHLKQNIDPRGVWN